MMRISAMYVYCKYYIFKPARNVVTFIRKECLSIQHIVFS